MSVQVGRYGLVELATGGVPRRAAVTSRERTVLLQDFGRHGEIMTALERLFGPYP